MFGGRITSFARRQAPLRPGTRGQGTGQGVAGSVTERGWTQAVKEAARGRRIHAAGQGGYIARLTKERGGGYLVDFPDLPGCLTEGRTLRAALDNARQALSGWLYVAIKHGDEIPRARVHLSRGCHRVVPDLDVAIPLTILAARKRRGLTQQAMARALGVTQQAYRKLEMPGKSNPTLKTLERLSKVLDLELELRAA